MIGGAAGGVTVGDQARSHLERRLGLAVGHRDLAVANPPLNLRARRVGEMPCDELVEPQSGIGLSRHQADGRGVGHGRSAAAGGTLTAATAAVSRDVADRARSLSSMMIASGAISTEKNCEVDNPQIAPRGSPR